MELADICYQEIKKHLEGTDIRTYSMDGYGGYPRPTTSFFIRKK